MIATQRAWIVSSIAVAAALTGLVLSCSSPPPPPPEPTAGPVSDVRVESSDGGTVIALHGAGGSPYQASRSENPTRVVVELPGTAVEGAAISTPVYDDWVQEVVLQSTPPGDGEVTTLVEVTLSQDTGFDVFPMGDSLEIHIGAPADAFADAEVYDDAGYAAIEGEELPAAEGSDDWVELDEAAAMDDAWFEDTQVADTDGSLSDDGTWQQAAAPVELKAATKLLSVDPEGSSDGTVIRIVADGMPSGFNSFTLDEPARLVVDMPGIASEVSQAEMLVGSPHADKIRVGQHEDKVRVVIDGGSHEQPFDERQISPAPDGMVIALGGGSAVEAALADARNALSQPAMAPQELAANMDATEHDALPEEASDTLGSAWPEEEAGLADTAQYADGSHPMIEAVEFLPGADADRIVIQSDQPIDYSVFQPDAETYVLLFSGATLSPSASTQLLPDPGGPVSLVSAFAQPELETPQVRLVVKRAAGLEPSVGQFESEIVLGFDRQGVANTLPVLSGESGGAQSTAPAKAMAQLDDQLHGDSGPQAAENFTSEQQFTVPASLDADAAVDYLQEGGLLDGKEYMGRRISLDFKDVDIRDVLRLIADVSDLNVIAGDEVQGNVTIRLVDVPWDQALDVILLTKGLGFVRVGNVLRIAPADILKQEEEARLQERRAKEKLEDLVVKLQPVNYADVEEISKLVTRLLTPRGSVDVDKRTNTIIIKDIAAVIDEATALVKAIDTQTPQVMIEARIVEANLDFSREIGAEFGFGSEPNEDENDFIIGGVTPNTIGSPDEPGGGEGFPWNQANNVVFSNPITNSATGLMNLGAFLLDEKASVDFRLTAAELNGEGKVISSPRVVHARQPRSADRARCVDSLPDLRERRCAARVHRRRAAAPRDAAHHGRPQHHHVAGSGA